MQNQEEFIQSSVEEVKAEQIPDEKFDPSTILDQNLLQQILESEDPNTIQLAIQNLKTFLKENSTSFQFFTQAIIHFFQIESNMLKFQQFLKNLPQRMSIYNQFGLQSLFYRSFSQIYNDNKDNIEITVAERQSLANQWKDLPTNNLIEYIQRFELGDLIPQEEIILQIVEFMGSHIDKKKANEAQQLIRTFQSNPKIFPQLANDLINSMTNNKEASRAADILKGFNLDADNFPELKKRLKKTCVRYFAQQKPWYYIEELFCNDLEMLGFACEDIWNFFKFYNDEKNNAFSIAKRWKLTEGGYIQKQDICDNFSQFFNSLIQQHHKCHILECLKNEEQLGNLTYIENPLKSNDQFAPVEECLNLKEKGFYLNIETDFKIKQNDITFIEGEGPELDRAIEEILAAKIVGLDTEFSGGFTKLEQIDTEICLIQIATDKAVFLFDGIKLPKTEKTTKFFHDLLKSDIRKCGQSIQGDFELILKHFGIPAFEIPEKIDLHTIFKKLETEQLSKYDQMSNWRQRPLRQSQIHYGAMDAVVSLQCYLKMGEVFGQERVEAAI